MLFSLHAQDMNRHSESNDQQQNFHPPRFGENDHAKENGTPQIDQGRCFDKSWNAASSFVIFEILAKKSIIEQPTFHPC